MQNAELFTLTYGAIVRQLLTDLEEVDEVNKQLDQMYIYELCSTDTSDQGMFGVWRVLMSGIDTDTCDYIKLCHFFKLLSVSTC